MTYDYVIVGAGSAGCVLANRLSANPASRVLVLEAGGRDWHPFIHMPAGLAKLVNNKRINWDYYTEPEPALAHRRLWWPRGKVLGGSSSINAMCYTRGAPGDYDAWAEATGDRRWSWDALLPVFKHAEDGWKRVRIGGIEFELVKPCSRCVFTTVDFERGEFDPTGEPLKTLITYRRGERGVTFGQNVIPRGTGTVRVGDTVEVLA